MRKVLIYWFILFLSSCAKDTAIMEEARIDGPTVTTVSYSEFIKKTDLNRMGSLKTMFVSPNSRGKLMGPDLDQIFVESFRINKDSVRQLVTERGTSYVFNTALGTAHARSFQNLTINFYGDKIFAFITTYYPSDAWLLARKTNTHIPFEGNVTYARLDSEIALSKQGPPSINKLGAINTKNSAVRNKTASAQTVCNYFNIVETIAYGCSYGNHMPWDESCPWNLGAAVPYGQYKAGYHVISREVQICTVIDVGDEPFPSPGGGSGGSGGNDTSPYPPDDYNPCEPGQKCTDILDDPHMPAQLFVSQLGITNQNEINFLNDPANYLILGYFINYFSFDSSWQGQKFIRWSVRELASGNITWEQLYNGFLREYDEVQLDFDPTITVAPSWINNSSYFSYQNLPTLSSYKSNYPKNADGSYEMSSGSVYYLVGGDVLQMKIDAEKRGEGVNFQNACALRVSLALLKSGINIPHIPGVTFRGDDINGNEAYFFLRAQHLYDWMMKEFYHGNRIDLTNADRSNANGDGFKNALNNKQGIYIFIPSDPGYYGASGHAGIYTDPPLTKYYFEHRVKNIALWELH